MDGSQFHSSSSSGVMGEAASGGGSGRRSKEIESLSLEISKYPRDLLQTFLVPRNSNPPQQTESGKEDEEEVELNLGLSLGGKFGVDKSNRGLIRSSSIAGSIPSTNEDDPVAPPPTMVPSLVRTSSLPLETEEEWRKRKELQTLRRMEAKRRRSEKQRCMRESGEERGGSEASSNLNFRGKLEKEQRFAAVANKLGSTMAMPFGLPKGGIGGGIDVGVRGRGGFFSLQGLLAQQASQGSGESQGGGSSQGPSSGGRSPVSTHLWHERGSQEASGSLGTKSEGRCLAYGSEMESPRKQPEVADNEKKRETGTSSNSLEDMPSVFTIGDGPSGRKVDGILYRYGKGEEVRIMCICHGNFFSAAEFVKHAGGHDVEHPLRHIVVNPSSSPF
ncbi:hypothetical protein Ancab_020889 [Ancistrocladus abbreviatus]